MVFINKGNAFNKTNVNTLKEAMHKVAPVRRTLYQQNEGNQLSSLHRIILTVRSF